MNKGIFFQQNFPFGAFGPRQWSIQEARRSFRWLKQLGYNSIVFAPLGIHLLEERETTILEQGALFHSCIGAQPDFTVGDCYCPADRYYGSPEGLDRAGRFRDQIRIAREEGLTPWLEVFTTLGAPGFVQDHPELSPYDSTDLFVEGIALCPSQPLAKQHLLEFHREQIRYFDAVEGFILWFRDPGGCMCELCTPQGRMMAQVGNEYYRMIRSIRPNAPVSFMSWHVQADEVAEVSKHLHEDIMVFEAPRIHALDTPEENYSARIGLWKQCGRTVEAWIEIQENPTALLPAVYPLRIDRTMKRIRALGLEGVWATCTQNPYIFPLHIWLLPLLWEGTASLDELLAEYFTRSYGADSVVHGMQYVKDMELAWNQIQSSSLYEAGFIGLFVTTFPQRMLPEKIIKRGIPAQVRIDLEEALMRSRQALRSAEAFADRFRLYHSLEANILVVSAEVFALRVEMRHAKLAVLDALHQGRAELAVSEWAHVQDACHRMVAAARSAPNTDVLAKHFRRLELLPARLKVLGQHLAELARRKEFRSIQQKIYIADQYSDRKSR